MTGRPRQASGTTEYVARPVRKGLRRSRTVGICKRIGAASCARWLGVRCRPQGQIFEPTYSAALVRHRLLTNFVVPSLLGLFPDFRQEFHHFASFSKLAHFAGAFDFLKNPMQAGCSEHPAHSGCGMGFVS